MLAIILNNSSFFSNGRGFRNQKKRIVYQQNVCSNSNRTRNATFRFIYCALISAVGNKMLNAISVILFKTTNVLAMVTFFSTVVKLNTKCNNAKPKKWRRNVWLYSPSVSVFSGAYHSVGCYIRRSAFQTIAIKQEKNLFSRTFETWTANGSLISLHTHASHTFTIVETFSFLKPFIYVLNRFSWATIPKNEILYLHRLFFILSCCCFLSHAFFLSSFLDIVVAQKHSHIIYSIAKQYLR